jgi:hypothetical protein
MQAEEDRYADLEKPMEDVRNMAAIVAKVMEENGRLEAGDVTISAQSWETFSFAVYHLAASPMWVFSVGIEHALDVAI